MIEMYDRDVMFEHMRRKELSDALAKNTEEVTKGVVSDTTNKIALNMINMNISVEDISKATGLSIEEINKLKKS